MCVEKVLLWQFELLEQENSGLSWLLDCFTPSHSFVWWSFPDTNLFKSTGTCKLDTHFHSSSRTQWLPGHRTVVRCFVFYNSIKINWQQCMNIYYIYILYYNMHVFNVCLRFLYIWYTPNMAVALMQPWLIISLSWHQAAWRSHHGSHGSRGAWSTEVPGITWQYLVAFGKIWSGIQFIHLVQFISIYFHMFHEF